jgi:hypothetical protein
VKNPPNRIKRWAWIAGVWLMFGLGILTGTSLDKPVPTFLNVGNNLGASGNVTANVTSNVSTQTTGTPATFTLTPPYQGVMLEVGPVAERSISLPRVIETRVMLPPMWASDEVRGIRKRFRG